MAIALAELLTGPLAWQLVWPHYVGLAARAFFEAFFADLDFRVDLPRHAGTNLLQYLTFGSLNPNHRLLKINELIEVFADKHFQNVFVTNPDEKLFAPAFPYAWVSDWPVWVPGGPRVGHIH